MESNALYYSLLVKYSCFPYCMYQASIPIEPKLYLFIYFKSTTVSCSEKFYFVTSKQSIFWKLFCAFLFISNLCRAVTTQKATANKFVISHAHATTSLRLDVFLKGIRLLLVTVKDLSAFPSQKNCQGRLKSPPSVSTP